MPWYGQLLTILAFIGGGLGARAMDLPGEIVGGLIATAISCAPGLVNSVRNGRPGKP